MSQEYIKRKAKELIRRFDTRDPLQIAQALGISVKYADIGALKGFYTVMLGNRFIVVNQNLSEQEQRLVLAHELGHDQLHKHLAAEDSIRQTILYDLSSKAEFEANLFAAHLLLEAETAEAMIKEGLSLQETAARLNTDENLLAILFNHSLPYRSDFLKLHRPTQE